MHNELQKLCTGADLNAEPDLLLEPVYGIRQWYVRHSHPRGMALEGQFGNYVWYLDTPQHVAVCHGGSLQVARTALEAINPTLPDTPGRLVASVLQGLKLPDELGAAPRSSTLLQVRSADRSLDLKMTGTVRLYGDSAFDNLERTISQQLHSLLSAAGPLPDCPVIAELTLRTYDSVNHRPATPSCTCGFYAYHTRSGLANNLIRANIPVVFGLVEATGSITIGSDGLRMERCRILTLTQPLQWRYDDGDGISNAYWRQVHYKEPETAALVRELPAQHGIQVVSSLQGLLTQAGEYGIMTDEVHYAVQPNLRSV